MSKKITITALIAIMAISLLAGTVLAHTVFFACWDNRDGTLSCEGGYTDGESAKGARVKVADLNGTLLFSGQLDQTGTLTFNRPAGEFTVTLEGGAGHAVVIHSKNIK
ncbi:MAG: hypothetical protein LBR56_00155 [Sporomusaceae bacterium]|jgi:hypothetical protein|nr:hypothetical protein [Sporomusaceae bacterium]